MYLVTLKLVSVVPGSIFIELYQVVAIFIALKSLVKFVSNLPKKNSPSDFCPSSVRPNILSPFHPAFSLSTLPNCTLVLYMTQFVMRRCNEVHARCIRSNAGVPNFASYATVTKLLGIKTAKEELHAFGRTRPDTRLPQLRAGGQGPYLRSLDHLGRSSEVGKK